jgi:acyl-CoA carboxylase subunit beta
MSGRVYDDGVIDPRDTRTILGLCLWLVGRRALSEPTGFGVFRM